MSPAIKDQAKCGLPNIDGIEFVNYVNEEQLEDVMRLVGQDLSEPYSGKFNVKIRKYVLYMC